MVKAHYLGSPMERGQHDYSAKRPAAMDFPLTGGKEQSCELKAQLPHPPKYLCPRAVQDCCPQDPRHQRVNAAACTHTSPACSLPARRTATLHQSCVCQHLRHLCTSRKIGKYLSGRQRRGFPPSKLPRSKARKQNYKAGPLAEPLATSHPPAQALSRGTVAAQRGE